MTRHSYDKMLRPGSYKLHTKKRTFPKIFSAHDFDERKPSVLILHATAYLFAVRVRQYEYIGVISLQQRDECTDVITPVFTSNRLVMLLHV